MPKPIQKMVQDLLAEADVKINGRRPWDIQVKNDNFYLRAVKSGTLGLGESYMAGDWDCQAIDQLLDRITRVDLAKKAGQNLRVILTTLASKIIDPTPAYKAFEIGQKHYDIGNDLFEAMLDKQLVYTCGYWKFASTLDEAQEDKLDLICKKIGLKRGMTVLDIGGGWGSFARFAAKNYGVSVVNVTVSKEQVALANQRCKGLKVENRLQDYRDLPTDLKEKDKFDRIVSIGMFEHVGYRHYGAFMDIVRKSLKKDGLFLLHTIGLNISTTIGDPWILKYIFPNSVAPSLKYIADSIENKFILEDLHNFGADYDKTLMAWHHNFEANWPKLKDNYSETFHRMWRLYLLSCAGMFRARNLQLWQIVLSPTGIPGGYKSIR